MKYCWLLVFLAACRGAPGAKPSRSQSQSERVSNPLIDSFYRFETVFTETIAQNSVNLSLPGD
ncbi:MAG: hypothetical protein ABIK62_04300 [candidate division WOR-3 bacterium]